MTPEQHADNIAKWTNPGLRQAIIDEIAAAVTEEREACAELAKSMIGATRHEIAAAIRARK